MKFLDSLTENFEIYLFYAGGNVKLNFKTDGLLNLFDLLSIIHEKN